MAGPPGLSGGDLSVRERAAAQSRATRPAAPVTSVQLALDLGDGPADGEVQRAAGDDRVRAGARRARDPRARREPPRRRLLPPVPRRARGGPLDRAARAAQPLGAAGRRGEGGHPDPADPVRPAGDLPDPRRRHRPGRRDVLRGRPGSLRRHGVPLLAAGGARRGTPDRAAGRLAAGHRVLGARRCSPTGGAPAGSTRRWPRSTGVPAPARGGRPGAGGPAGAGALQRLPDVAVRRHQAGRPVHRARSPARWPASCGTAAPGARDESPRVGDMDLTPPEGSLRSPSGGDPEKHRPLERRTAARTAVVWDAVRRCSDASRRWPVVDIGGGTGGFAVRLAELGHQVTVVDPSPDALAALGRRAAESDVADRVTGVQGDLAGLADLVTERRPTWCSATACSRSSTTRRRRWPRSAGCSVPAAPSACWSASGTPRSSPGRWPATSAQARRRARRHWRRHLGGAPVHRPGGHRPARRQRLHPAGGARRPGVRRPGPRLAARPRARCRRRPARARARRRRPPRVPHPRHPAARARHALRLAGRTPEGAARIPRSRGNSRHDRRPLRRLPRPARRHGRVLRHGGDPGPARPRRPAGDRGRRAPRGGAVGDVPGPPVRRALRRCR